jgi:cytochrome c5
MENEVHIHEHPSLIKTPSQLVAAVVLAFVVPVALIVMVVQMVTGGLRTDRSQPGMDENAIAARIKPVGEVNFVPAGSAPAAPATPVAPAGSAQAGTPAPSPVSATATKSGDQVYQSACAMCHSAGLAGAPKFGDKAAWKGRIGQGVAVLHDHAIKGIRGMPAKGGNSALADAEVEAAVDYMVSQAR